VMKFSLLLFDLLCNQLKFLPDLLPCHLRRKIVI
jgi:hypothetical protein